MKSYLNEVMAEEKSNHTKNSSKLSQRLRRAWPQRQNQMEKISAELNLTVSTARKGILESSGGAILPQAYHLTKCRDKHGVVVGSSDMLRKGCCGVQVNLTVGIELNEVIGERPAVLEGPFFQVSGEAESFAISVAISKLHKSVQSRACAGESERGEGGGGALQNVDTFKFKTKHGKLY